MRHANDRYSRRVALLKRVLPAVGLTLLTLVALWPRLGPLLESVRFGFPIIDLREARELRMLNPRYAGFDRFNRPYVVTSAIGRQSPSRDDLMSLENPRAEMTMHNGAVVVMTAASAMYQSQAQLLDLFDGVNLVHENGTRFTTKAAHIDVGANTAQGHDPVNGHGPSGDIAAQGFTITDKGDTIVFNGESNLLLKGTKPGAPSPTTPPTLPAGIAETAARVEAEAVADAVSKAPPAPPVAQVAPADSSAKLDGAVKSRNVAKRDGKLPVTGSPSGTRARRDAG